LQGKRNFYFRKSTNSAIEILVKKSKAAFCGLIFVLTFP